MLPTKGITMSQDPLKQPEPAKTKPRTPASTRQEVSQSTSRAFQKVSQTLKQTWNRAKPILRAQTIKLLRLTVRGLEWVLLKLETESAETTSTSASTQSSSQETSAAQAPSGLIPTSDLDKVSESRQPSPDLGRNQERLHLGFERLTGWWSIALGQIRSRLPESLNQKLSNPALTGVITAAFLLLVWTTTAILPDRSPKVANTPDTQLEPAKGLRVPQELNAPPESPDQSTGEEVSPEPVKSIPSPEPVVVPAIEPELTPDQKLLAAFKQQVSELSNQYTTGLVQFVQADIPNHRLMLKLNRSWYNLSYDQQNQLVGELFGQAQDFDFSKLEIKDPQEALLARSPVVGPSMVVLKRQA